MRLAVGMTVVVVQDVVIMMSQGLKTSCQAITGWAMDRDVVRVAVAVVGRDRGFTRRKWPGQVVEGMNDFENNMEQSIVSCKERGPGPGMGDRWWFGFGAGGRCVARWRWCRDSDLNEGSGKPGKSDGDPNCLFQGSDCGEKRENTRGRGKGEAGQRPT